jgi:hypothetical protein
VHTGYERQRDAFRKAAPFLPFGVETVSIPFDGVAMPGYAYRVAPAGQRRAEDRCAGLRSRPVPLCMTAMGAITAEGGGHCEGMGQMLWQQAAFAWLSEAIATGRAGNPGA